MALTAEQQSNVDLQNALDAERRAHDIVMETCRSKLEAVRLARDTLVENKRNLPVGEREVTSADILSFATELTTYINN
jgi:hypothetical protein